MSDKLVNCNRLHGRSPYWPAALTALLLGVFCSTAPAWGQWPEAGPDATLAVPGGPLPEAASLWHGPEPLEVGGPLPAEIGPPDFGNCPPGCPRVWYVQVDALYFNREGESGATLSQNFALDEFEWELGSRVTLGRQYDCLDGWEFTYVGPFDFEETEQLNSMTNSLQSLLIPDGGYVAANLNTFNNAAIHLQEYESDLNSFELNRKWYGWDVMSIMLGVRYMQIDEEFLFFSRNANGDGILLAETDNSLIGAQVGAEIIYPSTRRLSVGFKGKAGIYANIAEEGVFVVNNAVTLASNADDSIAFAAMGEIGVFATYQLRPRIALRANYDAWYIYGLAIAGDQDVQFVRPTMGTRIDTEGEVFYHGGSVGVEVAF